MKFLIVLALAAVAAADHARPAYHAPAPAYHAPAPAYHAARPSYGHQQSYDEPANYEFSYNVADDYAGTRFNANENRNGYSTNGAYSVDLPDGRTQTVTYTVADDYSGYIADVQYSGEARYDTHAAPSYHAPAPAYHAPAPAYHAPARPAYHAPARPTYHN